MDLINVLLSVLIILIFMAIFTILRTMNSPYIQRFEMMLKGKVEKMNYADSYRIKFFYKGREFEFYEMKFEKRKGEETIQNNFIFLKAHTKSKLFLRSADEVDKEYFEIVLGPSPEGSRYEMIKWEKEDNFKDFRFMTNDTIILDRYFSIAEIRKNLEYYKTPSVYLMPFLPIVFDDHNVTLHFCLGKKFLNDLIHNPRSLKKHIVNLHFLAEELDKLYA